jgi:SpoVK/Ycf46/Vps4 family AAA+-type ATPase
MSQFDYIKDIAKFGLENDREGLLSALNELVKYSKDTKKLNFALQLQSIIKETVRMQQVGSIVRSGSTGNHQRMEDRELNDLIIEKVTSDYRMDNLVSSEKTKQQLSYFLQEHKSAEILHKFDLPISNKLLLYGPSGCGKTLASYIIAGELGKMMVVVNLGAVVSAKLGETSKNLAKIFRNAAAEDCIIFIDEFDSLGKVRDYSQDHGEMKRVTNTILQLFDYLPQSSLLIAATNQVEMIDDALLRRFDVSVNFDLPNEGQIKELVHLTMKNGKFSFDKKTAVPKVIKEAVGLSYYSIQKTLITAMKHSIFLLKGTSIPLTSQIKTDAWKSLVIQEKSELRK